MDRSRDFVQAALRIGAGDDVGALSDGAGRARLVLNGSALRTFFLVLVAFVVSGLATIYFQRSTAMDAAQTQGQIESHSQAAPDQGAPSEVDPDQGAQAQRPDPAPLQSDRQVSEEAGEQIVVYVSGAVNAPGLVSLAVPARINDAIEGAGGAAAEADLDAINLAETVSDGVQVHVPRRGEPPAGAGAGAPGKVNINTADVTALQQIPGVGPVTAQAIVSWREQHGRFSSVEQLVEVSGIGPKTLERMRDFVTA